MKTCTKCKLEKSLDQFSKQSTLSDGLKKQCKDCDKMYANNYQNINKIKLSNNAKEYYIKNQEKISNRTNEYYHTNKPVVSIKKKEYRLKNLIEIRRKGKLYRESNPDRMKEYRELNSEKIKDTVRKYHIKNMDLVNSITARRRAAKLQATPKWLTKEQLKEIRFFYTKAKLMEKETGIKYHVDHIIPLQGEKVRGLHVPWNLQILTAEENIRKKNK